MIIPAFIVTAKIYISLKQDRKVTMYLPVNLLVNNDLPFK